MTSRLMYSASQGGRPARWWLHPAAFAGRASIVVLVTLVATAALAYSSSHTYGVDVNAYWGAAMRLREGAPLYLLGDATAGDVYRYAPWFAYAWIPLTYLPRDAVVAAWIAVLTVAALLSTAPLLARGTATGLCAFVLITPFQLDGAAWGNVQPLLVLMLVWGMERRSGPLWIALGASLKAAPGMLALVYFARGEHRRGLATIGLTLLFTAPMVLHGLATYDTNVGVAQMSLYSVSPLLFAGGALLAAGAIFLLRRSPFIWMAGAVAVVAWLPRLMTYEIGLIVVGMAGVWQSEFNRLTRRVAVLARPVAQ